MIKEAIEYLVGLKENKTYEINGETYSDNALCHIPNHHVDYPSEIIVTGLDSIVQLVQSELHDFHGLTIYVRVVDENRVRVFTRCDDHMARNNLYCAVCDVPGFKGGWRSHEEAVIELRSCFIPSADTEYLLDLLSRVNMESGVSTSDNGVSQTVEARQGISLKSKVVIKPRVKLIPYRTFLEVPQPESEFILRMDNDGRVGLFEADGGMWKLKAKGAIKNYMADHLSSEIAHGNVVVMA